MSETPTNAELASQIRSLDRRLFDKEEGWLPRIEAQTTKTNGRVTSLEKYSASREDVEKLQRWQSYVIGFCACIVIILLPVALLLIQFYFKLHA